MLNNRIRESYDNQLLTEASAAKDDKNISTTFKGLRSYAVEAFGKVTPFSLINNSYF
jgi:hypothetical protein